jgi:hypothetical protein
MALDSTDARRFVDGLSGGTSMNQPAPPSWDGRPQQGHHLPSYQQQWPMPPVGYGPYLVQPAPAVEGPGVFRYVALGCGTLLVLGALVLVGLLVIPRTAATPVVVTAGTGSGAPSPVVVGTVASSSSGRSGAVDGSSCGRTASGHSVTVVNGTVPCDHAVTVAAQWLSSGTTPGDGEGSAGTMYSWTCTSSGTGGGWCTSKMGSHLSVGP